MVLAPPLVQVLDENGKVLGSSTPPLRKVAVSSSGREPNDSQR